MNPPTVKKYRSYTNRKSPRPGVSRTFRVRKPPSSINRRTNAARKIQHTFRTRRKKSPQLAQIPTRPTVNQMMNNILSMKDLKYLRHLQMSTATGRAGPRVQYHSGTTGSW